MLRQGGASITETDNDDRSVWFWLQEYCEHFKGIQKKADAYSLLRCFASPDPTPDAFIPDDEDEDTFIANIRDTRHFTPTHRELLEQTERAHTNANLLLYRLHRLDLLCRERDGGSDCARLLIPDLQNIVLDYLCESATLLAYLPDVELRSKNTIAEAATADDWARV